MINRWLVLFSIFVLAACSEQADDRSTRNDTGSTAAPAVVLIGVDGAEWQVIEDLVARGELPGFARLIDEGAFGHLINPGPQVSPVVWTTFATGHFGSEHGILDFVHPYDSDSGKQPVDVSLRREPALWNVLDAYEKRSTVIGYFVSWPAEAIDGVIVSDRAFQNLEHSVWPKSLEPESQETRQAVFRAQAGLYERFFPWPYDESQAEDESDPYYPAARMVRGRVDNRIRADDYLRRMTEQLHDEPADLLISYYRVVDIVSHSLWRFYDNSDWEDMPEAVLQDNLGGVLEESYRYVDEIIQDLLQRYGGTSNIFVISDHGFGSGTGRYLPRFSDMLTGNHRPNGVVLAHGPAIEPGPVEPITIMEIYPTLAYLLDVPISDRVPGSIAYRLIRESYSASNEPTFVQRYDIGWSAPGEQVVDASAQAEEMESLRGLGYIGEGVTLADRAGEGGFDFWQVDAGLLVGNLHGEIVYHLIHQDRGAADETINALKRNRPQLLPQVLARVRAKVHSLRREIPGAEDLAPGLDAFVETHQGSTSR